MSKKAEAEVKPLDVIHARMRAWKGSKDWHLGITVAQWQLWEKKLEQFAVSVPVKWLDMRLEEILEYATNEQIRCGLLEVRPEKALVKMLYLRAKAEGKHLLLKGPRLQTPAETVGQAVRTNRCAKCGSDDTLEMAIQKRASDEPTDAEFHCLGCGHKWKHRN